jgi:hypothetical protein
MVHCTLAPRYPAACMGFGTSWLGTTRWGSNDNQFGLFNESCKCTNKQDKVPAPTMGTRGQKGRVEMVGHPLTGLPPPAPLSGLVNMIITAT